MRFEANRACDVGIIPLGLVFRNRSIPCANARIVDLAETDVGGPKVIETGWSWKLSRCVCASL